MSERRMRMRVYRKTRRAPHFTEERRWAWLCQWCHAGGGYVHDVRLSIVYGEAWRHGWKCWGWWLRNTPPVYLSALNSDERALISNLSRSEPVPSSSRQGGPESAQTCAPARENLPRQATSTLNRGENR